MGTVLQNDEEVLAVWNKLMEENADAFETDIERTFLAMKIAVQCIDIGIGRGLLELEEFADNECGIRKSEIPLWEYFRPMIWLTVQVAFVVGKARWLLYTLLESYHYTGPQAVQGFVYMVSGVVIVEGGNSRSVQEFFRSLIPEHMQEAFDRYFLAEHLK